MFDVFVAAAPLLWDRQAKPQQNLLSLAITWLSLNILNFTRLMWGFFLHDNGVSWFWAHSVVSGFVYAGILCYVLRQRTW